MTTEACLDFCYDKGYKYAGTEWSKECFCDNDFRHGGVPADEGCDMPCSGAPGETCGGGLRLSVYEYTGGLSSPEITGWTSQGCYTDSVDHRALPKQVYVDGDMTIEKCTDKCFSKGFIFAGVEFGRECFCSSSIGASGMPATDGCDMPCTGNYHENCGGGNRLNIYQYTGAAPLPSTGEWALIGTTGCYADVVDNRALGLRVYVDGAMTVPKCTAKCLSLNYGYAGVEYADECYCSYTIPQAGLTASDACTMPCSGDISTICGGPDSLTVYKYLGNALTAQPTVLDSYNGFTSQGCYTDSVQARIMTQINPTGPMTVEKCIDACHAAGYDVAGVEFGTECYCSANLPADNFKATSNCIVPCAGDSAHLCGGANRLNVYKYQAPTSVSTTDTSTPTSTDTSATQTSTSVPSLPHWDVKGCTKIKDTSKVVLNVDYHNYDDGTDTWATHEACQSDCLRWNFSYGAYMQGTHCYCTQAPFTETYTDGQCTTPCGGNSAEMCGGPDSYTVLSFSPPSDPAPVSAPAGSTYLGCSQNVGGTYDPNNRGTFIATDQPAYETCINYCITTNNPYAVIQESACNCVVNINPGATYGSTRCLSQTGSDQTELVGTSNSNSSQGPGSFQVFKINPPPTSTATVV